MTAILVTALLVGYAVWLASKLLPILEAKWKRQADIASDRNKIRLRYALVAEREVKLAESRVEKPKDRHPMPADLAARIAAWDDEFAREDERKYVEQLYAESGDWDAVRRAYAPPLADNQPEMQVTG